MKKLSLHIAITFLVLTGTTTLVTGPARAAVPDAAVNTGGATAAQCGISVQSPYRSGQLIYGSASVSCSQRAASVELVVCVESSQTGASNTFVPLGCATDQRTNASSANATAFAPCAPVPMHYRTMATVSVAGEDGLSYSGTTWSGSVVKSCI